MGEATGRIKGAVIREVLRWYLREHGKAGVGGVLDALPAEVRGELDARDDALGIRASRWYDAQLVHAMLDGLVAPYSPHERARMIHAATRAAVSTSARGVYGQLLARVVTPVLYARHVHRFWRQLHDGGFREIVIESPGVARSRTWDWPAHHPILCEVTGQTIAAIFEKMGERGVHAVRQACVSSGAPECVFLVTWDAGPR